MLTGLQLKNFKSWREVNAPLAPITGFFGTNSSGKSSLLQALLLMKQSAENSDQKQVLEFGNEKSLVNLGSFQDVIWQHETRKTLNLGFSWERFIPEVTSNESSAAPANLRENIEKSGEIDFLAEICQEDKILFVNYFRYKYNENSSVGIIKRQNHLNPVYYLKSLSSKKFHHFLSPDEIEVLSSDNIKEKGESKTKDDKFTSRLQQFLDEALSKLYYLGPIRAFPERFHIWTGAAPSTVGKQGENTIATLLASRVNGAKVLDTPLEAYIAQKLEQLGLIHGFRLEELKEGSNIFTVRVRRTPESPEVYLTDVGFGVSQILPVLVACFSAPEGSTIILEQPELHLHPSVQSGLADVFIDAYKTRGVQIILESHSEHLLRRLQRRMAEEAITPEDVKLYFCSLENGESKLTELDLDEYGNIRNYPEGFFGDRFEEMAATSEAGMKRRLELVGDS